MKINSQEISLAHRAFTFLNDDLNKLIESDKKLFDLIKTTLKSKATEIGVGIEFITLVCSSKNENNELLKTVALELSQKTNIGYDQIVTNVCSYCTQFTLHSSAFGYAYSSTN